MGFSRRGRSRNGRTGRTVLVVAGTRAGRLLVRASARLDAAPQDIPTYTHTCILKNVKTYLHTHTHAYTKTIGKDVRCAEVSFSWIR